MTTTELTNGLAVVCRGCQRQRCEDLGSLPDRLEFAGSRLGSAIPGGRLYRCRDCELVFRSPILDAASYSALYASANADVWADTATGLRTDQVLVKNYLESQLPAGGRVLDVGCFTGTALRALPDRFLKFGIEKSEKAAQVARTHGVNIIGDDLYAIDELSERFDAVTAMDVIEHTVDPQRFLNSLLTLLKPGGVVLITTGDANAALWRRVKADFWYCSFAEHISFISQEWLERGQRKGPFRVVHLQRFQYESVGLVKKLIKLALLRLCALTNHRPAAYWSAHLSNDHLFAVVRRP